MLPDFLHELEKNFAGDLRFDLATRILYSTDASMYQITPLGVVVPKTQEDLISAVELAIKYKVPILPRGSGSSLGGQAIGEALILDCSRYLDSIINIDSEAHIAIVEPGVILADLNRAASKFGLMFGPDPASAERATMGGVIGNNATGAHSILYGMAADHLISADVILGDGLQETWDEDGNSKLVQATQLIREKYAQSIKQNYPKTWRNSAGYRLNYLLPWSPSIPPQWDEGDYGLSSSVYRPSSHVNLAGLLAGSEGTLAVMRRATVNLVPKPKNTILGVLTYESVVAACEDVPRLLEFKPSAVELIPQMIIRFARSLPGFGDQMSWLVGDPVAVLVVEFSGTDALAIKSAVRRLGDVVAIAESPEEQSRVWNVRKMGLGILDSRQQSARPIAFIEDCAVPVERLGDFVREVQKIMLDHNIEGGIYAHASGGCLHIRPILNLQNRKGVQALRSIGQQVLNLVLQLGGSMSSEHGDGIVSGEWIEKTYGRDLTEAMRFIKKTADPHGLFNPRKMFDAPPMDSHLRYGENYQVKAWNSALEFDHERGFAGAIEQCNGQGVCRKTSGVMCPSFQATREEAFSTRGRANLLRAMVQNPQPPIQSELPGSGSLAGSNLELNQAVFQSLDLCLACKGCSSECPSGVDMPRLKYEFMNKYYRDHRRPLHDYLFGYFHVVSKWLAHIAPLANSFMTMSWSRKIIAKIFGITDQRLFPIYATKSSKVAPHTQKTKKVIFLSDVFSRYFEPDVEQAAFDLLDASGFEILILPQIGAGASLLSKGFIDAARTHAGKVLDSIAVLDNESIISIVGCEPPEVYCLKHEYLGLVPERKSEIAGISKRVWLVEEFLLRQGGIDDLRVDNSQSFHDPFNGKKQITFHPHCHQRAEGPGEDGLPTGTNATTKLLEAFGFEVEVFDAACCGMAGTFGYDAEHYELSMKIGELSVLPRARSVDRIVSTGSACRLQIKQGAGKEAVHPLVLISSCLSSNDQK